MVWKVPRDLGCLFRAENRMKVSERFKRNHSILYLPEIILESRIIF